MTRWPRMLTRKDAAEYCGVSIPSFEREISLGRLPMPVKLGNRDHWCIKGLDAALDRITNANDEPDYIKDMKRRYGNSQAA